LEQLVEVLKEHDYQQVRWKERLGRRHSMMQAAVCLLDRKFYRYITDIDDRNKNNDAYIEKQNKKL
jgi:hypothetical protein